MHREDDRIQSETAHLPRRHLVIAGTGRAGTSFLVRYLTELGLDTTLSRQPHASWDSNANAGLEELGIAHEEQLPYVVKTPWMGQYVEQFLANPKISVDAFLIPVRNLVEAATSRAVLEMRGMHQQAPWMTELSRSWEVWGTTPGGMVHSLNPLDQARLLAVGFHDLIWHATKAEVPVHFLSFPRLVEDSEYLYRVLRPLLPAETTREQAFDAHSRTADLSKVRVRNEVATAVEGGERAFNSAHRAAEYPRSEEVDTLALRRELKRLRAELQGTSAEVQRWKNQADELRSLLLLATEVADNSASEVAELRTALGAESTRANQARDEVAALTGSRTWRATRPVRALLSKIKGSAGDAS